MNITVDFMHIPWCKYIRSLGGWLVIDIEIKISDDGFQAKHRLTDMSCTGSEPYILSVEHITNVGNGLAATNLEKNWQTLHWHLLMI